MIPQFLLVGLFMSSLGVMPVAHSEPIEAPKIDLAYEVTNNNTALIAAGSVASKRTAPRKTYQRVVTAYSSTADQTDSTPFITASGHLVHDGTVAANWLPMGTKVRIPEYFGDRVFVVDDRMNSRYPTRLDIWYNDRDDAIKFGTRTATIEVL